MREELVLALDIGTTSTKAVIFKCDGKLVAEAERMITSYYPKPGWVEQDPVEIERLSVAVIKEAIEQASIEKDDLITIGISCAMHSLICMDANDEPRSYAMIWADGRSNEQVQTLQQTIGANIYAKTGLPNHPMSPLSKLLWMKETDFKPYHEAAYFISIKEYVIQKWFDCRVIDYAMAAATGLFNRHTFDWDEELLTLAGIDHTQLSKIVPPTEVLTAIDKDIADEMGVSDQMPFVIGSADGQLSNLGSGAISKGEVAISVGTSGAIRQMIHGFEGSDQQETFCYAFTRERFIIGGATNNGGIALQWLMDLMDYEGGFAALIAEAEQVDRGADGLLFFPYINGERAPIWNQEAKGTFFGLSITHRKKHMVRAVLEGITYNLYQIGKSLEHQAGEPERIYVNGGLARSPLWVQMLADIFGKEVYLSESHHSAAWGAAWTALVGIKKVASFEEIKQNIPIKSVITPDKQAHADYQQIFQRYTEISADLVKHF